MELLEYSFFRNALIGVVLISICSAMIGTYIMSRRMVFLTGGITHACFGGLGLGYWLGFNPIACAAGFAVAGALGVDWLHRRNVRNDSAIAVVWAVGMALGTLFVFLTQGYVPELNAFLFGNVLTITPTDLYIFAGYTLLLLIFYCCMYRYIVAVSFDESFAMTRRLPAKFINISMIIFTSLAIVLTIKLIGIMLLMSLMTLPQITVELFSSRYKHLVYLSGVLSLIACVSGLVISYYISVPASASIVLVQIAFYIIGRLIRKFCGLFISCR